MIELIDNIIQMLMAGLVFSVAFFLAFAKCERESDGSREWTLVGLFAFEYFVGDVYSALYLLFYDTTSQNFYISELCWYTSYMFMILLLIHLSGERPFRMKSRFQILIPVFTVTMAVVFYVRKGDLVGNLVSIVIMTAAIWLVVNGLIEEARRDEGEEIKKPFYLVCALLIVLEYAMWISSSVYWPGDTLLNPYFWFDTAFSMCLIGLLHGMSRYHGINTRKAVRE